MAESMEQKRAAMLARLEGRGKAAAESKHEKKANREREERSLEELIEDSRVEIERGIVNEMTERRLVEAIALGPSKYLEAKLRELLAEARKAILERETKTMSAFTFYTGIRAAPPPRGEPAPPPPATDGDSSDDVDDAEEDEEVDQEMADAENGGAPQRGAEEDRKADIQCVAHHRHEETIDGSDGASVRLAHLDQCTISLNFCPSTIHVEALTDTTVITLPVQTSILIYGSKGLRLFGEAQQVRVHDVEASELSVAVRGTGGLILEHCRGVAVKKCSLTASGEAVPVHEGDEWRRVKDFDWLASGPSPHWREAPEAEWSTADVITREVTPFKRDS